VEPLVTPGSQGEAIGRLVVAGLVVTMLPALPFGAYLIYPFAILTTWFHEMGHGLTALLLGQHFEQLLIFANGSGVAESGIDPQASRFVHAGIAAGGPLAPSAVGALLIVASAHPRAWRAVLWLCVAAILASTGIWVRSPTGLWALPLVAAIIGFVAKTLIGLLDWGLSMQEAIDLPNVVYPRGALILERRRFDAALIEALDKSGADGVMVGRGAYGRPWFLRQVIAYLRDGRHLPSPAIEEQMATILEHYEAMLGHYGTDTGVKIARKHLGWYVKGLHGSAEFRNKVNQIPDSKGVLDALAAFYGPYLSKAAA